MNEKKLNKKIKQILSWWVCWNEYCAKDAGCQKDRKEQADKLLSLCKEYAKSEFERRQRVREVCDSINNL